MKKVQVKFNFSALKEKKVLITGGAGFLGSHLADRCLQSGAKVLVLDDLSTGRGANLSEARTFPGFRFVQGNANDNKIMEKAFRTFRPQYAAHYAAMVGVKRTQENPLEVLRDLDGISNFFRFAKKYGVKKIVFASSSEAYGEPVVTPSRENSPLNPQTTYGVVKLVGEEYVKACTKEGLPGVALRFFNVYGPRQNATPYGFVAGIFIRQVLEGKPPTIFGDGMQTRDFVYIDDNVEAVIRAMLSPKANGEVINIVGGRPIRINTLAEHIIKLGGKKLKPKYLPARTKGEVIHRYADGSKMKKLLGVTVSTSLEEGLRKTMEWYRATLL